MYIVYTFHLSLRQNRFFGIHVLYIWCTCVVIWCICCGLHVMMWCARDDVVHMFLCTCGANGLFMYSTYMWSLCLYVLHLCTFFGDFIGGCYVGEGSGMVEH